MTVRRVVAALAIFAVVATGVGLSIAVFTAPKAPPPAAPSPPAPKVPTPAEFQIGVVITDQNCAVPDNCTYKYRIEPKYVGFHPLPDHEIKVVYQVIGGHQPQTGDFTVAGSQARVLQDVPVDGPPDAHLTAVVTQIVG
ncbi:hypothetical protein DVS77_16490 [Mycolicibacterium moriokaense]|nr:hypothetical protein DVS77_16490 [Mycolicibacterium moriokaense]